MTFGAAKYGSHNWRGGMAWGRLAAAAFRHMAAWCRGEDTDAESGLSHLAHAAACVLMLLECTARDVGEDDRPTSTPVEPVVDTAGACGCGAHAGEHWRP